MLHVKLGWSRWRSLAVLLPVSLVMSWGCAPEGGADAQGAQAKLAVSLQMAQAHRYQECVDAARQAVKMKPDLAEAYSNIGFCSASMGNWDEGIRNTREALRIKPDLKIAGSNLAWMLQQKASPAGGNPGAPPLSRADSLMELSLQHAQAHRYKECIDTAGQALELKPGFAEAYNNIGWCTANMGNWDEGIRNVQQALAIKPDFPVARNNLAWMLQEKAKAGGGPSGPNPPSSSK